MKMLEEIKSLRKEYVFEQYTRIIEDYKDYEKITKTKMLSDIYKIYADYNNIIEICTASELKFLKIVLENDVSIEKELIYRELGDRHYKYKYEWELGALKDKFLLDRNFNKIGIPDEVKDNVKLAIENVNWKEKENIDRLNEFLVGYCKSQGSIILDTLISFTSRMTNIAEEKLKYHMLNNRLFKYYVYLYFESFDTLGKDIPILVHQDYYSIIEELDKQRRLQGLSGEKKIDIEEYRTLFYNDFNINNPKIKKFLYELEELPFFYHSAIKVIRDFSMLNIDREPLKNLIRTVPALADMDLSNFFKTMDEAMDEMPSGVLNGFTPNEAKKMKVEKFKIEQKKDQNYIKQLNACLSRSDANRFYKIYFALLEFTNNKYKINPSLKLYNKKGINPYLIRDIVDKFWENKDSIVLEFCLANPYKFNKEELEIASEFKNGIQRVFIIAKYEQEYTGFMLEDKIYMVKGVNDNIDNIIHYKDLPCVVTTSIIPFKGILIYDGMLRGLEITMGNDFDQMVEREYNNLMKYYHL